MGDAHGAEERRELSVRVQVAGAKRDGSRAVTDQMAGSRSDRGEPVGNVVRVADRRREQEQFGLARAENDRFFPDDTSLWIRNILRLVQNHET